MTRPATLVDPRVAAAVDVLLTGRLTLLQRRALAELLVAAAHAPGAQLLTVHRSAVDALGCRGRRRGA